MTKYDGHILELRGNKIVMEPQEAFGIVEAIMKWHEEHLAEERRLREAEEIDQEWTVGYARYGGIQDDDCPSLEAAMDYLIDGANEGQLSYSLSGYILCPDGRKIEGHELIDMLDERERTRAN